MTDIISTRPLRLAILQRVCPGYRSALFAGLSTEPGLDAMLFIGDDIPKSKVKNMPKFEGINHRKLKTRFLRLGARVLPWHSGLLGELKRFNPDVILCEGESHFLGYLQAIFYKCVFNRRVGLIHWCLVSLPGWPEIEGGGYRVWIKKLFRRFFDAFLVYSSFGGERLIKLGQPKERVFVATNVGEVEKFLALADVLAETRSEARAKLNLPDRFTVLCLGTLDANKRPEMLLDLAKAPGGEDANFLLLGSGPVLESLQARAKAEKITNLFLPGRIVEGLPMYYRAADALLIPGRGGIVISEAMAFGLPVIVHQADGTERDLVRNGETGMLLSAGEVEDFRKAVQYLIAHPGQCAEMGRQSARLVRSRFNTGNMVRQIVRAADYARDAAVRKRHLKKAI